MKPICVPCRRFYRPKKNGYWFIEGRPGENGALPGNAEPEKWKPYKLWNGDLWECHGCGAQIISGVGAQPGAEHYQSTFAADVISTGGSQLQINDR